MSSSRRNVVKAGIALATLGATAPGCRLEATPRRRGPYLERVGAPLPAREAEAAWRGLAWALRAMTASRRAEVADGVEAWWTALEAKEHPLGDLGLDENAAPLEEARAWLVPIWNTATVLTAHAWRLPGRDEWIAATRGGARAEAGVAAWSSKKVDDARARGARFAAWPVAASMLVEVEDADERERFLAAVRGHFCQRDSSIGMVVDPTLLTSVLPREFDVIRAIAERGRRRLARSGLLHDEGIVAQLVATVPASEPAAGWTRWLDLGHREILVVPRLGALARVDAFRDEIGGLARGVAARARFDVARE